MAKEKKSLDQVAEEQRKKLSGKNIYNDSDQYSSTHTRALSDDITPNHGKGTGVHMDTKNGGSQMDIKGNPSVPGSGRNGNLKFNHYSPNNPHKRPND